MPLLELSNVEARYGQIRALHGVSLTVDEGEVVVAARRERRREDDDPPRDLGHGAQVGRRRLRRALDREAQRPSRSRGSASRTCPRGAALRRALGLGQPAHGRVRPWRAEDVQDGGAPRVLGYFPWLEAARTSRPTLSGGEQQMLSLARALVSRPRLLMLDEPSLGLAPTSRRSCSDRAGLNAEEGLTVLVVEQNANIALTRPPARTCSRSARSRCLGRATSCGGTKVRRSYLGY